MDKISVKIQEVFDGPLDVLLNLIYKNKVDIYDIPIVLITEQYMEFMENVSDDMENLSEFIKMAATLLEIKARMLLPRQENNDEIQEDPRRELVEQLLEYKLYKYMSVQLEERASIHQDIIYGKPHIPDELEEYLPKTDPLELLDTVTITQLHDIFAKILRRNTRQESSKAQEPIFDKIQLDEVTVEDMMLEIMQRLDNNDELSFSALFEGRMSKIRIIVTFLGLLELIKMNKLRAVQDRVFEDIIITKTEVEYFVNEL